MSNACATAVADPHEFDPPSKAGSAGAHSAGKGGTAGKGGAAGKAGTGGTASKSPDAGVPSTGGTGGSGWAGAGGTGGTGGWSNTGGTNGGVGTGGTTGTAGSGSSSLGGSAGAGGAPACPGVCGQCYEIQTWPGIVYGTQSCTACMQTLCGTQLGELNVQCAPGTNTQCSQQCGYDNKCFCECMLGQPAACSAALDATYVCMYGNCVSACQ